MASASGSALAPASAGSAFDRRLAAILDLAARLFAEKGYEGTSIRDLSRLTEISLAGLYHYFESKEALLYLLQKHTLETVLAGARARVTAPGLAREEALLGFIANHLQFFLANRAAMKVLSHEDEVLTGAYREAIAALKHEYYELCLGLVKALGASGDVAPRTAVMSLFGMLNWVYTWHREGRDPKAESLAAEMCALFLHGLVPRPAADSRPRRQRARALATVSP